MTFARKEPDPAQVHAERRRELERKATAKPFQATRALRPGIPRAKLPDYDGSFPLEAARWVEAKYARR